MFYLIDVVLDALALAKTPNSERGVYWVIFGISVTAFICTFALYGFN